MDNRTRIEKMKESKRKQEQFRRQIKKLLPIASVAVCLIVVITLIVVFIRKNNKQEDDRVKTESIVSTQEEVVTVEPTDETQEEKAEEHTGRYYASRTDTTKQFSDDILSEYGVLIDLKNNAIIAERNADARIVPASMTKVMTILVAAEKTGDWEEEVTVTQDMIDYCFKNDCSTAGFEADEKVPLKDLFYGSILPSGGEAAVGLAIHTAGSQEAFVLMMNDKLKEMELDSTAHFTNCIGIYDEDHYCTSYDMAMIMEAAMENEKCREVLSAHTYNTAITEQHPEGLLLSNWFLRKIEDKDAGLTVVGAKTGYVVQSENCGVSLGKNSNGDEFICVTARTYSGWRCIYDHVAAYKNYTE